MVSVRIEDYTSLVLKDGIKVHKDIVSAVTDALQIIEEETGGQQVLKALQAAASRKDGKVEPEGHAFDRLSSLGLVQEDGNLDASVRAVANNALAVSGETVSVTSAVKGHAEQLSRRSFHDHLLEPEDLDSGHSVPSMDPKSASSFSGQDVSPHNSRGR